MTVLLIGATCVFMNVLIGYSGRHYMDSIGSYITGYGDTDRGEPDYFDPEQKKLDEELTIVVHGAQESFITTNWYITAAVTILGGVLAYFLSGHALKPLRTFTSQVEKVQLNNLTDMKISEDVLPEFRQFSRSFNQMLERLDEGFTAQRQFTGNAAHELRTPLSLMQAQLELFSAEHPEVLPETADFLRLLREQTERMTQMTKTLLEMSDLKTVSCTDRIELAPMVEEIFADLVPPGNTDMTSPHAPLFADAVNLPQLTLNFVLACIVTQSVSRSSDISGSLILTPSAFSAHRRISSPPTCIVRASIPESVQRIIRSPRTLTLGASSPISASAPFSRRLDAAS